MSRHVPRELTVWIVVRVARGKRDDIVAVFLSQARAVAFIDACPSGEYVLDEYDVCEAAEQGLTEVER